MSSTKNLEWERVIDEEHGALIYRLTGVMGETDGAFHLHDALREDLESADDGVPKRVVLDMANVEFLSSTGIGIVASCHTSAQNGGKVFVLSAVPRQAARVLDITGVGAIVPRYASEKDAIDPDAPPLKQSY